MKILITFEFRQINQSCLLAYLGIRGNGSTSNIISRLWNAIPLLAYWDIYKNYYANKQEGIGAYLTGATVDVEEIENIIIKLNGGLVYNDVGCLVDSSDTLTIESIYDNPNDLGAYVKFGANDDFVYSKNWYLPFKNIQIQSIPNGRYIISLSECDASYYYLHSFDSDIIEKKKNVGIRTFPLSNIDDMREKIMKQSFNSALL